MQGSYEELCEKVREAGLAKKTYLFYSIVTIFIFLGIGFGFYFITVTDVWWLQILNAIFLSFILMQAALLSHDLSHQQIFESKKKNKFFAVIMWSLVCGLSEERWYQIHNAHHKHVNHDGLDPDLDAPFVFAKGHKKSTDNRLTKYIRPYQHIIFFAILPLLYPNLMFHSIKKMLEIESKKMFIELILSITHYVFFLFMVFWFLPWEIAVMFIVVSGITIGYFMGMAFAPNHKGREVAHFDSPTTWLDQIILTRNLYPSTFLFYFFGGLNYQIEHHLFPNISRFNYPKIHKIVKNYCYENNIQYYETTWLNSMKEIYKSLKENRI
jgi:fatty acid desaturase